MIIKKDIESLILKHGLKDYQWIGPEEIVISQWVRMKCICGCDEFGRPACPPHMPSVQECHELIHEYNHIIIFRFEKEVAYNDFPKKWAREVSYQLLNLEKEIFLSGCYKTFFLNAFSCNLCHECKAGKKACKYPKLLRPTPEALGIDVFTTVRQLDYPIEVLQEDSKVMNRYAILLIE